MDPPDLTLADDLTLPNDVDAAERNSDVEDAAAERKSELEDCREELCDGKGV